MPRRNIYSSGGRSSHTEEKTTTQEYVTPPHQSTETHHKGHHLPMHIHKHPKTKGVNQDGESGRKGFHPLKFFKICFLSSCHASMLVNILWPVVPAAFAVRYALNDHAVLIFTLVYLAMIPAANLIGFAGQELARKLPSVIGVILETTLGSVVEIILFTVLIVKNSRGEGIGIPVIRGAILGSILANMLLCLGICFIAGGLRHEDKEQSFHEAVSEVGSGLLLVAGFGLIVPAAFAASLSATEGEAINTALNANGTLVDGMAEDWILSISRGTAVILLLAYIVYIVFQTTSHHGLYEDILKADELEDRDRHRDLNKEKLTLIECFVAITIGITITSFMAIFLVEQIPFIIEHHNISEAFMGLILVPLVEKVAEHLTAIDEAWDNQANFALTHVLGASIQTALLNTPLVVFVGWGLGAQMDLNFRPFEAIVLVLAIIVVGNFLRDGKSNYLEGSLCVAVYVIIAVAAFYYPPRGGHGAESIGETSGETGGETGQGGEPTPSETATAAATEAARLLVRTVLG